MESLYNQNEDYCNLDAGVLALMNDVPEDASTTQLHNRIAMIKLQQSTILGHSKYAAKMLEQAIEEGSKDRTAHSLLQERMEKLQDRISRAKRHEQESSSSSSSSPGQQQDKNQEGKSDDDKDDRIIDSGEVNLAEHERLKKELKEQAARADSLEDLLESHLTKEILDIQKQQEAIQNQEARLKTRIQLVEKAIEQLPEDRSNKLRDKLGETLLLCHSSYNDQQRATQQSCVACHDRAAVLAVIPCGHLCLCDNCLKTVEHKPDIKKQCPVCRGLLLSTVKIYTTK